MYLSILQTVNLSSGKSTGLPEVTLLIGCEAWTQIAVFKTVLLFSLPFNLSTPYTQSINLAMLKVEYNKRFPSRFFKRLSSYNSF